jgi:hypothetical protein
MAAAAAAAAEGRIADAVAGFQAVHAGFERLGQRYAAATLAIDAAMLLPDQPAIRALAESARPLLEELRAAADLDDLDRALAVAAPARAPDPVTATRPTPGPGPSG